MNEINVEAELYMNDLRQCVRRALLDGKMSALLSARDLVKAAKKEAHELVPSSHPVVIELKKCCNRLNKAIDQINDNQASILLQGMASAVARTNDLHARRQPMGMRAELSNVEAAVNCIARCKPYVQYAIERVRGKPYVETLQEIRDERDQLYDAYEMLRATLENEERERIQKIQREAEEATARVQRVSQEYAPKAAELHALFLSSMQKKELGQARRTLQQLQTEDFRLGLLEFLKSYTEYRAFHEKAERELKLMEEMAARRQQQLKRMQPIPILRR